MIRQCSLLLFKRKISTNYPRRSPVRFTINVVFGKYLLVTNTVSCGVLMFMGDLIQQEIEYQRKIIHKRYDYDRLKRMFIVGLTMGPVHHFYYKFVNTMYPKTDLKHISYKILADQFIMSPICISQFFYTLDFLEGRTIAESTAEFKRKFITVYTVDWCVWPPIQFLNFCFVPPQFQVIYINLVTMLYNVFLSYIKHDVD